jgi:hypothetical protein
MHLKTGFYILLASLALTGLFSCLGGSEEVQYEISNDAQLVSFSLSNDSLADLAKAKFSIDQVNSRIYNYDSLPYLTDTARIASRAIVKYTAGSGAEPSIRLEYLNGDTTWIASGDTLRMASSFYLQLYAPSGQSKTYTVHINIHQADPDSVQYRPVNLSEVPAVSIPDWTSITQHCPAEWEVISCLGFLRPSEQKKLSLIVKNGNDLHFAFSSDLISYQLGTKIPDDFPVAGFSVNNDTTFAGMLTVMTNMQSVWATSDGLYWTKISNTQAWLPVIEGGNAFVYNNEIWFLNGKIVNGDYNPKLYYSTDHGVVWKEKPAKMQPPAAFPLRQDAQVVVDASGKWFYIIGGTPADNDAWHVALNARLFDH